jgi:two-component system, sensor histidine kinase YesM
VFPDGKEAVFMGNFCITFHANANEKHPCGDGNPNEEFRDYFVPGEQAKLQAEIRACVSCCHQSIAVIDDDLLRWVVRTALQRTAHRNLSALFSGGIQKRLSLYFLVFAVVPLGTVLVIAITSIFNSFVSQYADASLDTLALISRSVDQYYRDVDQLPAIISSDSQMMNAMRRGLSTDRNALAYAQYVLEVLLAQHSEIQDIRLYGAADSTLLSIDKRTGLTNVQHESMTSLGNDIPFLQAVTNGAATYLSAIRDYESQRVAIFTYDARIVDSAHTLGFLSADLDLSRLIDLFADARLSRRDTLFILNGQKEIMYYQGSGTRIDEILSLTKKAVKGNKSRGYVIERHARGGDIILYVYLERPAATLYRTISIGNLLSLANPLIVRSIAAAALVVLLVIVSLYFLSSSIVAPIRRLTEQMKAIGRGRFLAKVTVREDGSELETLARQFNDMAGQIDRLFNETYRLQLANKTAQLEALRAQLNPHFLYNTLQTVKYLAYRANVPVIETIVDKLRDILRYSLRGGDALVTLAEELEHVSRYLALQQYRFGSKLRFSLELPAELSAFPVPPMILQPLVENSVVHGLEACEKDVSVQVACGRRDGRVRIEVVDDGEGMSEAKLREVRLLLRREENRTETKLGLLNVFQRLKFTYGEGFTMDVESSPGTRTSVIIQIPWQEGEREHDVLDC